MKKNALIPTSEILQNTEEERVSPLGKSSHAFTYDEMAWHKLVPPIFLCEEGSVKCLGQL